MTIRHALILVTLCALSSSSMGVPARPGPAKSMALLFVRGNAVWIANGQGTDQRLITHNADSPAWSPDHKRIAFARGGEVWVSSRDGGNQRQLTHWSAGMPKLTLGDPPEIRISWDPIEPVLTVSREEAYEVVRGKQRTGVTGSVLYDVPLAPGRSREIVERFGPEEGGAEYQFSNQECPAWSRDGQWMAFARNGDIWMVSRHKATRGELRRWDRDATRLSAPARYDDPDYRASRMNIGVKGLSWSPDGRHLAYCLERLGGSGVLWIRVLTIRRGDRGEPVVVAAKAVCENGTSPSFSPDGKWIACHSYDQSGPSVYVISVDGRIRQRLIANGSDAAW